MTRTMEETARVLNEQTRRQEYLNRESQRILKLQNSVWDDLRVYLKKKHKLNIPKKTFSFSKFLYESKKFDYEEFVNRISIAKARLMFSLCARRIGIGMIKTGDEMYTFVPLKNLDADKLEELYESFKNSQRFNVTPDGVENETTDDVVNL